MGPRMTRKGANRGGPWTAEEDLKLARAIEVHGPRMWKLVAVEAGLSRGGKSCRLRWLNYLRPNLKRGNISDQEEDLILRLHRLLGNRWSLIAGRLPGRTDNEIKNYWNTHLHRKVERTEKKNQSGCSHQEPLVDNGNGRSVTADEEEFRSLGHEVQIDRVDEGPLNSDWMSRFMELDESWFDFTFPM
ncbi:hypothetical protein MLD38_006497 [Melastoma candidum]|uniref:Uncharacterized protein n=1 Tax=Melastoma candidum TaxID=119954 RepID=A0ACB9RPZ0_9MYRT|nr:hypothetical protein MLD38_006497 [Melastoma candidum]